VREVGPGTLARARVLSQHLQCCAGTTSCLKGVQLKVGGPRSWRVILTRRSRMRSPQLRSRRPRVALDADYVLVATGRRPFTSNLGLEKLNIAMKGPFVQVNEYRLYLGTGSEHRMIRSVSD
jgi:hypothetical protein